MPGPGRSIIHTGGMMWIAYLRPISHPKSIAFHTFILLSHTSVHCDIMPSRHDSTRLLHRDLSDREALHVCSSPSLR